MSNIIQTQEEINDRKEELLKRLERYKQEKHLIEETISIKISNEQQREILKQLCKIHEYQIKNIELESINLMKEFLSHQKDMVVKRDHKRQKLVKEIVTLQKKIISGSILHCENISGSILHCENTVFSPDFLMWKFCGKAQFPPSFGRFA